MRIRLPISISVIALLAAACMATGQSSENSMYFPVGKPPAKLKDFQCFGLNRENGKLTGWVMMDRENPNDSTVEMSHVQLKGQQLTFSTLPKNGVTFRFQGLKKRNGIEGTVTRLKNGRKVADGKMRFRAGSGG